MWLDRIKGFCSSSSPLSNFVRSLSSNWNSHVGPAGKISDKISNKISGRLWSRSGIPLRIKEFQEFLHERPRAMAHNPRLAKTFIATLWMPPISQDRYLHAAFFDSRLRVCGLRTPWTRAIISIWPSMGERLCITDLEERSTFRSKVNR